MNYSFSKTSLFKQCPRQFEKMLNPSAFRNNRFLEIGRVCHSHIEKYLKGEKFEYISIPNSKFNIKTEVYNILSTQLFNELDFILGDKHLRIEEYFKVPIYENKLKFDRDVKKVLDFCDGLITINNKELKKIKENNYKFDGGVLTLQNNNNIKITFDNYFTLELVKCDNNYEVKYYLSGRIDCFFVDKDKLVIVDFKTSKRDGNGIYHFDIQQLIGYAYLLTKSYLEYKDLQIKGLFWFVRDQTKKVIDIIEEDLNIFERELKDTIKEITECQNLGVYSPKKNKFCKYCDYKNDCEVYCE